MINILIGLCYVLSLMACILVPMYIFTHFIILGWILLLVVLWGIGDWLLND